jgi:hypothetical protein
MMKIEILIALLAISLGIGIGMIRSIVYPEESKKRVEDLIEPIPPHGFRPDIVERQLRLTKEQINEI